MRSYQPIGLSLMIREMGNIIIIRNFIGMREKREGSDERTNWFLLEGRSHTIKCK